MWLTVLKYVAKFAVTSGLAEVGKNWLKNKIMGSAEKAEKKAHEYLIKVENKVDAVIEELNKNE